MRSTSRSWGLRGAQHHGVLEEQRVEEDGTGCCGRKTPGTPLLLPFPGAELCPKKSKKPHRKAESPMERQEAPGLE